MFPIGVPLSHAGPLQGAGPPPIVASAFTAPTLSDALQLHLQDMRLQGRRERSLRRVRESWAHIDREIGLHQPASVVTYRLCAEYFSRRTAAGMRPATIANELGALKRGLRLLVHAELLDKLPRFPQIRSNNARQIFLEDDELERVCAALPKDLAPYVRFLALTGWRRSEAASLTWEEIDWRTETIRIAPGKTKCGEARVFPFSRFPRMREILVHQREMREYFAERLKMSVPWVFLRWSGPNGSHGPWKVGRVYQVTDIRKAWVSACIAAGVNPKAVPHDMRRSTARRFERARVPRSVSMKLLGHRTASMFERYAITNEQDLIDGTAVVSDFLDAEGRS